MARELPALAELFIPRHARASRHGCCGAQGPTGRWREDRSALATDVPVSDAAGMYIRHDVSIDQPAHSVRRELLEPPDGWLPVPISRALGHRSYVVRVGFRAAGARISKEVELTVGTPEAPGQWLVVPVSWRATGPEQLFPILDGKLTVQPLGPHSSRVWMGATYQPPLGGLGRELDDLALHNVAEATIREFVDGLGARLSTLAMGRPA